MQVNRQCQTAQSEHDKDRMNVIRQKNVNLALQHQVRSMEHILHSTKRAGDKSAMHELHRNAAWTELKTKKNSEHAKLWRLKAQTCTLQVTSVDFSHNFLRHHGLLQNHPPGQAKYAHVHSIPYVHTYMQEAHLRR